MKKKLDAEAQKAMAPTKAPLEDVLEYARIAINDPEIRELVQWEIDNPMRHDEESEGIRSLLGNKADKYVKSKGLSWKYTSPYMCAFMVVLRVMDGRLTGIDDPKARDVLKGDFFISCDEGEEK